LCAHTDKVKWFKYNNETYIFFTEDQIVLRTTIEATLDELNNLDPDLKNYVGNMLAALKIPWFNQEIFYYITPLFFYKMFICEHFYLVFSSI